MTAGAAGGQGTGSGRTGTLRRALVALALVAGLVLTGTPSTAQQTPPPATAPTAPETAPAGQGATPPAPSTATPAAPPAGPVATGGKLTISKGDAARATLDYTGWEGIAARAETTLADPNTPQSTLEFLRAQLVDWRSAFLGAQNANSARIATLRDQIAALGPVPADGAAEAVEIAQRRQALTDQLIRLQAPGLAAEEAHRRAEGLIREIDRTLRERQTDQLLQLWPTPANPANWSAALTAVQDLARALWTEGAARWKGEGRAEFLDNLPVIVLLGLLGLALVLRGMVLLQRITGRLPRPATTRGRRVAAVLSSLMGRVALPILGTTMLSIAAIMAGFTGPRGTELVAALPAVMVLPFTALWLGGLIFSAEAAAWRVDLPGLDLSAERRAEGRFLSALLGILVAVETLRAEAIDPSRAGEAASAVLAMPTLVAVGVLVLRLGQLLRRSVQAPALADAPGFTVRLVGLSGRAAIVIGLAGPLLGAVGYVPAASALVYPAAVSLGLLSLLFVLVRLVADLYGLAIRSDAADQDGLVPVLIGFAISIASLPLFALVWGARTEDLSELWQRFLGGFQLGATRVSPTDFLIFAVIFVAGYSATRLVQGALRGTVLPRTTLDPGGQTAIVSGTGYVGIILSALLAINFTGIDLSGLAIVAGALSVGIGFGLQNIVSNFVSGIILLIERPVSEGDWIEVGTVSGTVKSISVRSTRIQTFDRSDVIVPNTDLVAGRVINWTRYNLSGRLIVPVTVIHGSDTRKVERVLRAIAEAQPLVVLNPPPVVALMGFNNDGIQFEIRMILRDVNFSVSVRSEVNQQILERFAEEGIHIRPPPPPPPAPSVPVASLAELLHPPEVAVAGDGPKSGGRRPESTDALTKPADPAAF